MPSKRSVTSHYRGPKSASKANRSSSHLEAKGAKIQATKHDYGKVQFLYPLRALVETNKVFTFGAIKYDVGNWHSGEGFDWQRLYDSALGHIFASMLGQDVDGESGHQHLAHAQCCIAMLLEHQLTNHGHDTRSKANYIHAQEGRVALEHYNTRAVVEGPKLKKIVKRRA